MQRGNVKLLIASAVVIVIVLLASWAWYGDDDRDARAEVSVGDTMTYDIYRDGTYVSTVQQTILEIEDGTALVSGVYTEGFISTMGYVPLDEAGITMPEEDLGELVGDETVETAFGTKDCQIWRSYLDGLEYLYWCADNNVCYRYQYTETDGSVITSELVSTTLFDDAVTPEHAEAFAGVSLTPVPGAWYSLGLVDDGTVRVISYNILRTDGTSVIVDTYDNGVLTNPRILSVEEFNLMWINSGADTVGTETIMTPWGLVDAVVTSDTYDMGDGLVYEYTYWNDASGALMKTMVTVTDGDTVVDEQAYYCFQNDALVYEKDLADPEIRHEFMPGDSFTYMSYDQNGSSQVQYGVFDVWNDMVLLGFHDVDDQESWSWSVTNVAIPLVTDEEMGAPVGTDIVLTPFGAVECEIRPLVDDGSLLVYVHDGVVFAYMSTERGDRGLHILIETSLTSDAPVLEDPAVEGVESAPEAGDYVSFGVITEDGAWQEDWDVESVEDGSVTVTMGTDDGSSDTAPETLTMTIEEFMGLFTGGGSQSLGTEVIVTPFGTIEADVTREVQETDGATTTVDCWTDASGVVYKRITTVVGSDGDVTETREYLINNSLLVLPEA